MRITVKDVMTTDVASVEAGAAFKDVAEGQRTAAGRRPAGPRRS